MIVCPTCGNENPEGSRFCSNCGTALTRPDAAEADASATAADEPDQTDPDRSVRPGRVSVPPMPEPRTWTAPATRPPHDAGGVPATAPEWKMSDAGPLPEPRGRRRGLWVIVGILGACLMVCVGLTVWGNTDSGTRFLNDLATSVSEAATPRAATPAAD